MDERVEGAAVRAMSSDAPDAAFEARLPEAIRLAFRVAYGVLRNRADAEDVAQEAAVRSHAHRGSLPDEQSLRAWLVRVSWRLALDHRRSGRRRERREQIAGESAAVGDAEAEAAARQARERLWAAVDALPEKLRVVTVLAALQGYDVREVATMLDLPEGTVKSRLHLARRRLAEELRWTVRASSGN